MKRIAAALLCAALLLPALPAPGENALTSGGYEYELQADGTAWITRGPGSAGGLAVPERLDGHPVSGIGPAAFREDMALIALTLPEGLRSVGAYAFMYCKNLREILLPASLTEIGPAAFFACESLGPVRLPQGLASLGEQAFGDCYALTAFSVAGEGGTYAARDGVLFDTRSGTLAAYPAGRPDPSYALPEGIPGISPQAFCGAVNLRALSLPAGMAVLAPYALRAIYNLRTLDLPEGLTAIGDWAVSECYALEEVTLPASLTALGQAAFTNCWTLAAIRVAPGNPVFASLDGVAYDRGMTTLLAFPCGSALEDFAIPPGVEAVADLAFAYSARLRRVTLPEGARTIGRQAFFCCARLEEVVLPASVQAIGKRAFELDTILTLRAPEGSFAQTYAGENGIRWAP